MLLPRRIPILLLDEGRLVKTTRFSDPVYIGDPINVVQIFNKKEVDELILLNISKNRYDTPINFNLLEEIASECFAPMSYGGGIKSLEEIEKILYTGIEKVIINESGFQHPEFIQQAVEQFGSSSIVSAIDYKEEDNTRRVYRKGGTELIDDSLIEVCKRFEQLGVGEICLSSISREGTYSGYDEALIQELKGQLTISVVLNGGAGSLNDLQTVVDAGWAAAAGSLFSLRPPHKAVLISYPKATH